jgi:hypothetical protein
VVEVRDTRRRQEQGGPGNQEQFKPYRLEIQRAAPPEHVVADFPSINVAQLPAGTNFLVSSATSLPFEPFLEFLADKAFTRSSRHLRLHKSIKTVEAWTSDLRDFFAFLDAMKIVWQDANEDILLAQSTQVKQSRNWPRARPSRIFDTALDSRRNRLTPLALREAAAVVVCGFFASNTGASEVRFRTSSASWTSHASSPPWPNTSPPMRSSTPLDIPSIRPPSPA